VQLHSEVRSEAAQAVRLGRCVDRAGEGSQNTQLDAAADKRAVFGAERCRKPSGEQLQVVNDTTTELENTRAGN